MNKNEHPNNEESSESALHVMKGVASSHDGFASSKKKRFQKKAENLPDVNALAEKVAAGERKDLAKAITFIESNSRSHYKYGQELLQQLLPRTGKSIRIGITGVPGAGKSTFIEAFGHMLCESGLKTAVLAIDPSSSISGGSILGDKTRMELLAKHPNAFIRPSPSSGTLGGVHRKTRETMLLCEAAGFDVILVETVGVGQSEFIVRSMVDFFLLIMLTGAGDELQGMKKGIMELADAIVVNKADGDNKRLAEKTKQEFNQMLHMLQPATEGWESKAFTCSAINREGIRELWDMIQEFEKKMKDSGMFEERRRLQTKEWLHTLIMEQLKANFYEHTYVRSHLSHMEQMAMSGEITPAQAAEDLFTHVYHSGE
ncbi:methylmalonyl Co-A mutase-associated GTPase MeaB [Bacillus aerolatus]|uniref:Methylmalonyl Co-A mutase-associated GTPase MeaB n=1 Tax=Bacillus aerolatus TaxID=2653354 RepID=A0A6I1FJR6_9BACI|nr:methylmalonyl Co-A mutase-associated GTPase MeaB [Bacillus aerolatus]KAB7708830.1 methylmalonyl Co-A mutase-associated GTPase MeaB [Bacillus aerolatus]